MGGGNTEAERRAAERGTRIRDVVVRHETSRWQTAVCKGFHGQWVVKGGRGGPVRGPKGGAAVRDAVQRSKGNEPVPARSLEDTMRPVWRAMGDGWKGKCRYG